MRIAFLSTILDYPWGGADFLWTRAAEAAQARGDSLWLGLSPEVAAHPRVVALHSRGAEIQLRARPSVPTTLAARLARRLSRWSGAADPAVRSLRGFRPDIVVISCGAAYDLAYDPEWADWLRRSRVRCRLVANWQRERPELPELETNRLLEVYHAAEALYFVSTRNLEVTRRHLRDALPNARVIHNPLRWSERDVTAWPSPPPWGLATVSRLDSGKGVHLFLQAAREALPAEESWRINIHGRGPEEDNLRRLTAELGLAQRVGFPGHVSDLRAIWGANHLMVSASIEDGVPMTIPEALLCRRPVVATAVGGASDWVEEGVTGFICPSPTLDDLVRTLSEAWRQRDRWEQMGVAGAASVLARYHPDDYMQLIQP
jgi:L-malate glycosyltransferase